MKSVALHNLGCKVNAYEIEVMQQKLQESGYGIVPFEADADIYIINTCTVTNIADRKSRQMLHRAKHNNPDAVVVAVGCYVQADKDNRMDPCIDLAVGNNRKKDIVEILDAFLKEREADRGQNTSVERVLEDTVPDIAHENVYEEMRMEKSENHTRAHIKIQDGCNQFCAYCMIPYARGRVRSRKTADVVKEVERLAASGCQEVVLTGIHLSSYGTERKEDGENLLTLIQAVHQVEGIARIRLGSLEPQIVTENFAESLSRLPKICPRFHLSLQSGCTSTLKRMNRRYTAEEYEKRCDILRKFFSRPALTTDVITGFPGETEEEFAQSRAFVEKINFYETHIFPYSKREGTKAAVMPDQIPEAVKKERSQMLIELGRKHQQEFMETFLGEKKEVLFEEQQEIDGKLYWTGHTMEYLKVAMLSEENLSNQLLQVNLTEILRDGVLLGCRE